MGPSQRRNTQSVIFLPKASCLSCLSCLSCSDEKQVVTGDSTYWKIILTPQHVKTVYTVMYIKCLYNYVFESEYENIIFIKTRNSLSLTPVDQGEVGISATVIFETLTGEIATTHLELHNEGSTAIYYSWQQLLLPCHFPNLRSQRKTLCFHFNSSSGNKHTQSDTCWHHSYVRRCLSLCQPVTLRLSTGTQPASLFFILLPPPSKMWSFQVIPSGWCSYLNQRRRASKLNCGSSIPTLCCCKQPPYRSH